MKNRRLVLPCLLFFLCLCFARPAAAAPATTPATTQEENHTIEISVTSDKAGVMTQDIKNHDGTVLHIEKHPFLGIGDFTHASVTEDKDKSKAVLNVALTSSAALILRMRTEKNVGKRLVFIVDHEVVGAFPILGPFRGNIRIGPLDKEKANVLAITINKMGIPLIRPQPTKAPHEPESKPELPPQPPAAQPQPSETPPAP